MNFMEIRDPIHGAIEIHPHEKKIIDTRFFQRLRKIKQLGFGENSYPSATHNRYAHSIGAMHLAGRIVKIALENASLHAEVLQSFFYAERIAALLHDIGHGPLSHTTEFAMPLLQQLKLKAISPGEPTQRADHEDYTLKIILESSLTPILEKALEQWQIKPIHIACLIHPALPSPDGFFTHAGIDYRPLLSQLISSEIDVDRMDYLTRDSFYTGVSYGKFDLDWLISNLTHFIHDNKCYLSLSHKALYTFEDFLISRFHMFLMVYFHHKCVVYDELLSRYFLSPDCAYKLPSDIEEYVFFDDYHLYTHLSQSQNSWAQRISHRRPYQMIAEFHSGIPYGQKYQLKQEKHLQDLISGLSLQKVDYILKTTTGEFSKYFRQQDKVPMFVKYDSGFGPEQFFPLHECTDLFEKYKQDRTITRVYIDRE